MCWHCKHIYVIMPRVKRVEIGGIVMKRIVTIKTRNLEESQNNGGCGECQTSCQSACKTSCTVGNQKCENSKK